ncbi:MAG: hypothetical protein ACR2NX_03165, partial [Chthoniobacterales bacterium]
MKALLGIAAAAALAATPVFAHEGDEHGKSGEMKKVTGEVVDMACYVDHGATGEKHANCAQTYITSGLPAGMKAA